MNPKLGALRFDRSLFFVNVAYFEEAIIKLERSNPELKYILIVGSGINAIDASGIEMLTNLIDRLKTSGITLGFSGIKRQVMEVMDRTGLTDRIGAGNLFESDESALEALRKSLARER